MVTIARSDKTIDLEEELEAMRFRLTAYGRGKIYSALFRLAKVKNAHIALELLGYSGVNGEKCVKPQLYDILDNICAEYGMSPPKHPSTRGSYARNLRETSMPIVG